MKKSKKNLADRVSLKTTARKINPFEVHVNRQKYDVLGKKSKTEKGVPGISRSRAIKKRKATLLQEYNLRGKVNQFVDRRIGERDASMTADDKILARYTTERIKFHSRKSLYNLGDNEELTHRGESLADIEKFDDPKSDDDDDDQEDGRRRSGKLEQDFVSEAHFGGGMLKKVDGESKSRKDLIDQMIADSKKRKAEQQKLREQTLDLTEKLDTAWKDILPLVATPKNSRPDDNITLKSDRRFASYDILSKELIFEARGKATDKLKSEVEIAREEKKKLEELEKQRLARMSGDTSEKKGIKHRSADDLDDGFDFNDEGDLPLKKGKRKRATEESESSDDVPAELAPKDSGARSESSSDEDENDSSDESEAEKDEEGEEKNGSAEEEPDEESDDDDSSDDLSDLKSSGDESDEETPRKIEKPLAASKKPPSPSKTSAKTSSNDEVKIKEEPSEMIALKKSLKNLPFTLSVPDTYEEFEAMCAGREPEYQAVVVERMVKSNHPSLPDGSRQKLINLFTYCLQHLQDIGSDPDTMPSSFRVLDRLAPWLYDLTQFAPAATSSVLSDVLKEKYEDFLKRPRRFPGIDTLLFLKLVGILFPTSDYRHRIVTPTLVFMQHILASCRIQTSIDVSVGLFVTTLILEYTSLSKRFTPEAINFVRGVLRSFQPPESTLPTLPPFKPKPLFSLHVPPTSRFTQKELTPLGTMDLIVDTDSKIFKLRTINLALQLLDGFCENFDHSSQFLIVEPLVPLLQLGNYGRCLNERVQTVLDRIMILKKKKLYRLVTETKRPKPLKLYEPKIEDVYTFKKKRPMTKEKEEHDKLVYKYKKEVKGALREIRRDNTFLANLKFNETKSSDLERQRKVKEIFGAAAQQAGEIKKMKRAK